MRDPAYFKDYYREHPVRPPAVRDPLALAEGTVQNSARLGQGVPLLHPHIGLACQWEEPLERTWSGTALNLLRALEAVTTVTDLGVHLSPLQTNLLRISHARYRSGRFRTTWSHSRVTDAYNSRVIRHKLNRDATAGSCDAALVIESLATLPLPFFTYYDSSWDLRLSALSNPRAHTALRHSTIQRRRARERTVFGSATGVVAMSHWLAKSLVEQSGLPASKVHVVHPGIPAGWARDDIPIRTAPRRRLLFIGRQHKESDFFRKGGDIVVEALSVLRREVDPEITLTLAGMEEWPLPGEPPEGVRMVGVVPRNTVRALYDSHDLFVMPSRMEPFGLVFIEALARGLPCIGRDACAMPEIITPGLSGALVKSDDVGELVTVVAQALGDDSLYGNCQHRAAAMAAYFSFDRAAMQIAALVARTLGLSVPALA